MIGSVGMMWSLLNLAIILALVILVIYALVLSIIALKIYIRKNR